MNLGEICWTRMLNGSILHPKGISPSPPSYEESWVAVTWNSRSGLALKLTVWKTDREGGDMQGVLLGPWRKGKGGDVLRVAELSGCYFSLVGPPTGGLWDKIRPTELSHSRLLSSCILGAKYGLDLLRMLVSQSKEAQPLPSGSPCLLGKELVLAQVHAHKQGE